MKAKATQLNTQKIFWILAGVLFMLFMVYAYMVNTAIMSAVDRQKAQTNISKLSSETSNLESQYISIKSSINLSLAYSLGFKNETNTRFIARKNTGGSLTLR